MLRNGNVPRYQITLELTAEINLLESRTVRSPALKERIFQYAVSGPCDNRSGTAEFSLFNSVSLSGDGVFIFFFERIRFIGYAYT